MTEFPNKKTDFRYFNDGFEIDKDGFSNNNSQFYFFRRRLMLLAARSLACCTEVRYLEVSVYCA